MKKREHFNYENPEFSSLRDPMRAVMEAYGEAERYFASIKEITWAEWGLKALAGFLHSLEHKQPDYVDRFKEILSEKGLMVEYPTVRELTEDLYDLDRVFEACVSIIDHTDSALLKMIDEIEEGYPEFKALARKMENLQMENSSDRIFLLEAWSMWDNKPSYSSFDNWVEHHAPQIKQ